MHTSCSSSACLAYVGYAIIWWVVASVLLFLTWNYVISALYKKVPKAKWWQPFLLIATVMVLCAPCRMGTGGHWGSHGSCGNMSSCCHHEMSGCSHHEMSGCGGTCAGSCDHQCGENCQKGDCASGNCPHAQEGKAPEAKAQQGKK